MLTVPFEQLDIFPFHVDPWQTRENVCPVLLHVTCAVSSSSLTQDPAGTFSSAQPTAKNTMEVKSSRLNRNVSQMELFYFEIFLGR